MSMSQQDVEAMKAMGACLTFAGRGCIALAILALVLAIIFVGSCVK